MEGKRDTKSCAIVIPVYKNEMDEMERLSFRQCISVLALHDVFLVTYSDLDCSKYESIAADEGVGLHKLFFNKSFFKDVDGYNRLMLDKRFYLGFSDYEYILIHQLDAYIFRDELDFWCSKGFDYIGAPWFDGFKTASEGRLFAVGNGGFSLRRIKYFTNLLSTKKGIFSFKNLPTERNVFTRLKFIIGGYNRLDSHVRRCHYNEDMFYCIYLKNSRFAPMVPTPEEAAAFAFEKSPSFLYHLNGNRLPMGCHAFMKYEYTTFWVDKIY